MTQQKQLQRLNAEALARLGLHRDPFVDEPGERAFVFSDAAHKTQINVSLHMLQASDRFLVVRGGDGVGKTAFLEGLAMRKTPGLHFVRLEGNNDADFEGLVRQFLVQAGLVALEDDVTPGFAVAKLAEAVRAGERPVLLLDEAQALSDDVIADVIALRTETVAAGTPFGLVMAVEPSFDARLQAIREQAPGADQLHVIHLYPFSEKQAVDYIQQRVATSDVCSSKRKSERSWRAAAAYRRSSTRRRIRRSCRKRQKEWLVLARAEASGD